MPRKKGNKQSNATSTAPVIFAKCTGCQVNAELKACEFCEYPECPPCIEKHRQADELSQTKIMLQTKTDSIRQQTVLKCEILEKSIEKTTTSLDLLKTTKDIFGRTLDVEFDAYEQKLKQSQTINKQHLDDLKHMWAEFEKKTNTTSTEDFEQTNHIMDKTEANLAKKHIQLCFQPNVLSPSLGSLTESFSDPIASNLVQTKEQTLTAQPSSLSSDSTKPIDDDGKVENTNVVIPLNFNHLNKKSRLKIKVNVDYPMMCTDDKHLLYCPEGYLTLLNDQGHQISKIKRNFNVTDLCWSSYLNQFLVLENNGKLYSVDVNGSATKQLKQIKTFDIRIKSVTCYEEIFILSSADHGSFIEEYNLSDWKLVRKHKPPYSCQANQIIWQMKLNSNGSRLGIILQTNNNRCHTFELRNRNDMKIVQVVEISNNLCYSLLSLPDQQFLINTLIEKKHFLIDPNGCVKETITYVDEALIISAVLMNRKSLVIQTMQPNELRFYDL